MSPNADISVVTVQSIARETGLSPSSVSAVLSGQHVKRRIAAATVARVQAAAKRLGYVPNVTARSLRAKTSGTQHVVISILTSYEAPVFLVTQGLRALESESVRRRDTGVNYKVTVEMFHAGSLDALPGLIGGHRCNAAIITNTIDRDDRFLASVRLPFPVVLLGRRIAGYPSVSAQSEMMGRLAAEILRDAGRSKLAVLHPATLTQATRARLNAFIERAEELAGTPAIVACDSLQERAGYGAMRAFLRSGAECDGVFATTDSLAIGAYLAVKRSGRTIPREIAMVGVGDNPASDFIDPPLTCFEHTEETLNRTAARLLLDLMDGAPREDLVIDVPISPLLRESTGHPGKEPN